MRTVNNTYPPAGGVSHTPTQSDAAVSTRNGAAAGGTSREPLRIPSSYAIERPAGELSPVIRQPDLYRDVRGSQYIHDGSAWYPVRHDADNGTLRVWQPDNASKPQFPVQRDADGNFSLHNNVGLKGGGLFSDKPASESHFGETAGAANRQALGAQLRAMPSVSDPGSYANSVDLVNKGLSRLQAGLSEQAFGRISKNLDRVQNGHMTNAEASSSEYRTFMNDVHNPNLSQSDRNWSRFGAYLNRYAGVPYHAETDIANMHLNRNQDPLTRLNMQTFVQNDPKG